MKILLATDGSEQSKATAKLIAGRAFPVKTKIRIVSAYNKTPLNVRIDPMGVSEEFYARVDHDALKAAESATQETAHILRKKQPDINITTAVVEGSPKSVILDEAEAFGADLIIVGSHGNGMLERFLLGSVAQSVVLHASCSVEVVRTMGQRPS
ncbi:MAG: universal stress protein [Acidobacteriota bacterium]